MAGGISTTEPPGKLNKPHDHDQLIYDKGAKNRQWEKKTVSSINDARISEQCKRMKLENSLTFYTKINSKWVKDLNVRPDTIILGGKCRQNTF